MVFELPDVLLGPFFPKLTDAFVCKQEWAKKLQNA
jgi:hypothetical protein